MGPMTWKKLLTSPFTVVEKRFYPAEEEEEQRGNCENSKAHNIRPTPVTRDCWAVCVFLRWNREGPPGS